MDFKKLGQQVGQLKKQAENKLGDRAEPENLKRDGKELRNILSGDGSLAEKAKEAKAKVIDREKADTGKADAGKPDAGKPDTGKPAGSAGTEKPADE